MKSLEAGRKFVPKTSTPIPRQPPPQPPHKVHASKKNVDFFNFAERTFHGNWTFERSSTSSLVTAEPHLPIILVLALTLLLTLLSVVSRFIVAPGVVVDDDVETFDLVVAPPPPPVPSGSASWPIIPTPLVVAADDAAADDTAVSVVIVDEDEELPVQLLLFLELFLFITTDVDIPTLRC